MPRIRGANLEEHHAMVWSDLADALRQLLSERDYEAINMGHIAARAGLARNTLYNYAPDKDALVLALTHRATRPTVAQVTAVADRSEESAAGRLEEIIDVVLGMSTDQAMQLIFRPGGGPPVTEMPHGRENPFREIVVDVQRVVAEGSARGEFRRVDDVQLMVELLSGVVRAGAERVSRDPATFEATARATREVVLASLVPRG
ncbi:TetR/AcrR family transcriptional regulator [Streptomyces spiramenti]|uniref:TetR/AcrR family transcriptional regulator n=1 Tax=Streptomyces spiramenti TaxID=2720606 RepID=A0ABX1AS04_9ACTN|nr:TetR/AcrR family transcriptional regulator [Streptomyces spiramenti]NJP68516.1 TetR/AcrR family transcriptional regulator [Streptomyces spiramenti]